MLAAELKRTIPDQSARKQAGLAEDLKTVADAQDQPAIGGKGLHGLHDGAETGNRPGAQIVAVAKSARNDDRLTVAQRSFLVPKQPRRMPEDIAEHMHGVLVAIRSWKLEDGKIHLFLLMCCWEPRR